MPATPPSKLWTGALALLAGCLALPAAGHMLARGNPLSELAAQSPMVVVGVVASAQPTAEGARVALAVERVVRGPEVAGALRFTIDNHHPPQLAGGQRVLVFLNSTAPPFVSHQSALDVVELPGAERAREALLAAVEAYAGLQGAPVAERRTRLRALSLDHLESVSPALRREALLDLLALGGGRALGPADVAHVARLAERPDVPPTLGPGLVMLLASAPREGPAALSGLAERAASAQVRALAAQALARRRAKRPAAALPPAPTEAPASPPTKEEES